MWYKIPGIDPEYEINQQGEVRSCQYGYWRPMKAMKMTLGYRTFSLRKDGELKQITRHRALAITFIPNPQGLKEVNHIDGDKTNDALENLEWVSHGDNMRHAVRIGLTQRGDNHYRATLSDESVRQIQDLVKAGTEKFRDIAKRFNIHEGHVSDIARGGRSGFPAIITGRYRSPSQQTPKGFNSPSSKVPKEVAEAAINRVRAGEYIQDIARELGVGRTTLSRAMKRVQ